MHPEILRELTAQRGREVRARARQATLARAVNRTRRAIRRGTGTPDEVTEFVIPAIPDYVDGSFRAGLAGETVPGQPDQLGAGCPAA